MTICHNRHNSAKRFKHEGTETWRAEFYQSRHDQGHLRAALRFRHGKSRQTVKSTSDNSVSTLPSLPRKSTEN